MIVENNVDASPHISNTNELIKLLYGQQMNLPNNA